MKILDLLRCSEPRFQYTNVENCILIDLVGLRRLEKDDIEESNA